MIKNISIIGMGYIGLPLSIFLSNAKFNVTGFDISENRIKNINDHTIDIEEKLLNMLKTSIKNKFLKLSNELIKSECYIVCVPTPFDGNKADLSYLMDSLKSISKLLKQNDIIIIESTIPPNTCNDIIIPYFEEYTDLKYPDDFGVVHCPERVLPGNIFSEFVNNPRIFGGEAKWTSEAIKIYQKFVNSKMEETSLEVAEITKVFENSYRFINIAFANEIKRYCDSLNLNSSRIIELANKHPRVNILSPGIGVGGHCIPVDPLFLLNDSNHTTLIRTSKQINDEQPKYEVNLLLSKFKSKPAKLILFGKSYKKNVADLRESPALRFAEILNKNNIEIEHYDPLIDTDSSKSIISIVNKNSSADGIIVLVPHDTIVDEIKNNYDYILNSLKGERKIIIYQ